MGVNWANAVAKLHTFHSEYTDKSNNVFSIFCFSLDDKKKERKKERNLPVPSPWVSIPCWSALCTTSAARGASPTQN